MSSSLQERKSSLLLWMIGCVILLIDQLTKYWAYHFLPPLSYESYSYPYGGIGIFQNVLGIDFSLNFLTNKGAAWGVLGEYQGYLVSFRMALIGGLFWYLISGRSSAHWQLPLTLILVGAVGNVIDYFVYGYVIDMFHFVLWGYDFPVFNIADSAITIGVVILCLQSWFKT